MHVTCSLKAIFAISLHVTESIHNISILIKDKINNRYICALLSFQIGYTTILTLLVTSRYQKYVRVSNSPCKKDKATETPARRNLQNQVLGGAQVVRASVTGKRQSQNRKETFDLTWPLTSPYAPVMVWIMEHEEGNI